MTVYLTPPLRQQLEEVDDHHCAYCLTRQANSGQPRPGDGDMIEQKVLAYLQDRVAISKE